MKNFLKIILVLGIMKVTSVYGFDSYKSSGYFRLGGGWSEYGTSQSCVHLQNTPGYRPFRIGNECGGLYSEFVLSMLKGNPENKEGKAWFQTTVMMAMAADLLQSWEPTGDGNLTLSLRQIYTEIGNVTPGGGILWLGKRYYKRSDIHMFDLFLTENTGGRGFGVENTPVGSGKLHLAAVQYGSPNSVTVPTGSGTAAAPIETVFDVRYDVGPWDVNFILGKQSSKSASGEQDGASLYEGLQGLTLVGTYSLGLGKGRSNKTFFQYGSGIYGARFDNGNTFFGFGDSASVVLKGDSDGKEATEGSSSVRLSNQHIFNSNAYEYGIGLVLQSDNFGGRKLDGVNEADNRQITMLELRGSYYLSDHWKGTLDIGHAAVSKNTVMSGSNYEQKDQALNKVTLALEAVMSKGYWSRPSTRFFVTHGSWDDETAGSVNNVHNHQEDNKAALTFGFQVEYWW